MTGLLIACLRFNVTLEIIDKNIFYRSGLLKISVNMISLNLLMPLAIPMLLSRILNQQKCFPFNLKKKSFNILLYKLIRNAKVNKI